MTDYLGGEMVAGGKLKEVGTDHWNSPNLGATNEVGFSALPGGMRNPGWGQVGNPSSGGNLKNIGNVGYWYASDEYEDGFQINSAKTHNK